AEDGNLIRIGIVFEHKDAEWPAGSRGTMLNGGYEPSHHNLLVFNAVETFDYFCIGFFRLDFIDQVEISYFVLAEVLHLQFIVIERVSGQVDTDYFALVTQLGKQVPVLTLQKRGFRYIRISGSAKERHGRTVLVVLEIAGVFHQPVDAGLRGARTDKEKLCAV